VRSLPLEDPVARVVIPLPDRDFDVTEVAVPWKVLTRAGVDVVFATEAGTTPAADPRLLKGLPPGLRAGGDATTLYRELERAPEFVSPMHWSQLVPESFDGLFLVGGHAQGMKQYLESQQVQSFVSRFWTLSRPVAAICHGVLVLARTKAQGATHSVLFDKRTTCLPKYMERSAYLMTALVLGNYYRTYPEYVEDEVRAALAHAEQFERGPRTLMKRGSDTDDRATFVVEDGHYVSARWPGDAFALAKTFLARLSRVGATHQTAEKRAS
jgi:putative intracellular protease/amidase